MAHTFYRNHMKTRYKRSYIKKDPKKRLKQFEPTYRNPTWELSSSANIPDMSKHCPRQYMICDDSQNKPFTGLKSAKPIQVWDKANTIYTKSIPGAYQDLNYVSIQT